MQRRRLEQRLDLRLGKHLGHAQRLTRGHHVQTGIGHHALMTQRPGVITAQRGQPAIGGARTRLGMARGKPRFDVARDRVVQPAVSRLAQDLLESGEIAPVGGQRIGSEAVLKPDGVDERCDCDGPGLAHG